MEIGSRFRINDGTTSHIKISLKEDTLGVGASRKDAETGWLNNSKSYQEVLDRLAQSSMNTKSDGPEKEKSDKKKKKNKSEKKSKKSKDAKVSKKKSEESQKAPTILKSAHRAKFIRNKSVSSYSEAQLKEILGGINI